ncbi:RNA pol II accessory factor, Cdc73 family-domain-containing protein [Lineolata rhizophorae]|uniref:RNA pol II accessory factor, Cdc73 family-domain-containing protein n=1 Tax=Lineolata rhizophorae TaxID=578093 RepID=A0A6A6NTG2_9PEZI|nr:RNA pol II accessory factor, Cdc73 family-domain-containing protein [Lineolata rhizophorae]
MPDALVLLRTSITTSQPPVPCAGDGSPQPNLALATNVVFPHTKTANSPAISLPLDTPTRFYTSDTTPADLRSLLFAYTKKDAPIPDYIAATQRLNDELAAPGAAGGKVVNLVFVQRLDLIAWLDGGSDESENIRPLKGAEEVGGAAAAASRVESGVTGATAPGQRPVREKDARLVEILKGERTMGDRNTVLRGVKPTDFSHVRKVAAMFLNRSRNSRPGQSSQGSNQSNPALVSNLRKPKRVEPIILLSPSASSLIRMPNVRTFLQEGFFAPASSSLSSGTNANILHVQRLMPSIDPVRPLRFILVDSPDQFKPDYWQRVVAVFTTGQEWQFKNYKWTQPTELFSHARGIYVGWSGDKVPQSVYNWGSNVYHAALDKWTPGQERAANMWRDREVVEGIWTEIEEFMRKRGWGKEGMR